MAKGDFLRVAVARERRERMKEPHVVVKEREGNVWWKAYIEHNVISLFLMVMLLGFFSLLVCIATAVARSGAEKRVFRNRPLLRWRPPG